MGPMSPDYPTLAHHPPYVTRLSHGETHSRHIHQTLSEALSNIPDTFKVIQRHSGQSMKPQTHSRHIHQTLSEALSNIQDTFKMIQRHIGQSMKPQTHSRHIRQTLSEALSNIPDTFKMIQMHLGLSIRHIHIPDTFQTHSPNTLRS